jgi:uncharacterized protein YeaO (DUF488 family)
MSAGEIRTRRWNDPRRPDDGIRILICRYRPRGLPKAKETWDVVASNLGPSKKLHAAFYGKNGQTPLGWDEYRRLYLEEMKEQEKDIDFLAGKVASGQTITLLCSSACTDETHCHRTLLKQLIETRVAQRAGTIGSESPRGDVVPGP